MFGMTKKELSRIAVMVVLSAFMMLSVGALPPTNVVAIQATDDAYVVADTSDESDPEKLRDAKFGTLDFVRTWYAWHAVGPEQIVAIGLVRFDLDPVKGKDIKSAQLQMFSTGTTLTQPARLVDVNLITNGDWKQSDVTYNARPTWAPSAIATTAVYGPGVWYSWDVSGAVMAQAKKGGPLSLVVGLRAIDDKSEEQVLFASTETGQNMPRLIVEYAPSGFQLTWYYIAGAGVVLVLFAGAAFFVGRRMSGPKGGKRSGTEKAVSVS